MDVGRLRNRIKIQTVTESPSGSGEPVETWETRHHVWASIRQMSGSELFEAQQVTPSVTHKIRLRYCQGVISEMRILFGSRTLQIVSVENVAEHDAELVLLCKEEA